METDREKEWRGDATALLNAAASTPGPSRRELSPRVWAIRSSRRTAQETWGDTADERPANNTGALATLSPHGAGGLDISRIRGRRRDSEECSARWGWRHTPTSTTSTAGVERMKAGKMHCIQRQLQTSYAPRGRGGRRCTGVGPQRMCGAGPDIPGPNQRHPEPGGRLCRFGPRRAEMLRGGEKQSVTHTQDEGSWSKDCLGVLRRQRLTRSYPEVGGLSFSAGCPTFARHTAGEPPPRNQAGASKFTRTELPDGICFGPFPGFHAQSDTLPLRGASSANK